MLVLFYSLRDKILWLIRVGAYKNQLMIPYIFNGSVGYPHGESGSSESKEMGKNFDYTFIKWASIIINA